MEAPLHLVQDLGHSTGSAPKGGASDHLKREGSEGVGQVERLPSSPTRSRRLAVASIAGVFRTIAAQAAARQLLSGGRHERRKCCQAAGVEKRLARRANAGPVFAPALSLRLIVSSSDATRSWFRSCQAMLNLRGLTGAHT